MHPTTRHLDAFVAKIPDIPRHKGKLSVLLAVTERARRLPMPLSDVDFLTPRGGQVAGTGGGATGKILRRHGIARRLSSEGGRTSRGSVDLMRKYLEALNALHAAGKLDFEVAEEFWIGCVHRFFLATPIRVRIDASWSMARIVSEIMTQAYARQSETPGTMVAGAVLQHLVGAKLRTAMPHAEIPCCGFAVADQQTGRDGDFVIGDTAIHVTTAPSEQLLDKCQRNINGGLHAVIVTTRGGAGGAEAHARNLGLQDCVSVLTAEEFVTTNVLELGGFTRSGRHETLRQIIATYNAIIAEVETDPSLQLDLG